MLYLGIDQHRKHLTVNIRNEVGDVVLRRQVSTEWERVRTFFEGLCQEAEDGFVAIVEVCGFNDWLVAMLGEYQCREIVVIQPETRSKRKTDRRDADQLSQTLWVNRRRLLEGKPVQGLRRIMPPSPETAENRQLTALRRRMGQLRTRTINKIQHLLLKHNLQQECPTKGLQTKRARRWLAEMPLGEIDRFEMDQLLAQWDLWESQMEALDAKIKERQQADETAIIVSSAPGAGAYGSLALASRIGSIDRFARPGSLANYWGLTPGCRNSGDAKDRLGSITKQGSAMARFILGQMVLHVLRKDPSMKAWYGRIKKRRGSKIARVAVMRCLACILWHMVKYKQPYVRGGPPRVEQMKEAFRVFGQPG